MSIIDEDLLDTFRWLRRCERCGVSVHGCEPHHLTSRGMGGWSRFDVRVNLIGVCNLCHRSLHDGNVKRAELLDIVARRERTTADDIMDTIYRLRRGE